jgi:hypothetical protein
MRTEDIKARVDALLSGEANSTVKGHELFNGALSLMTILYGSGSPQVQSLSRTAESLTGRFNGTGLDNQLSMVAYGALQNLKAEIDAGLIGSLQRTVTGEVLTDFLQSARAALDEKGDDAKNVAAVLTAALFEDTIRRLATTNGIPHADKLQDVITELKNKGILQGPQVGIATAYLNFRNNALHAQWDKVQRESVASALGFVEQLLLRHFA